MKFLAQPNPGPLVREYGTALVFVCGLALVSLGAYLIAPAAGLITGGCLLVASVIAYERSAAAVPPQRVGPE